MNKETISKSIIEQLDEISKKEINIPTFIKISNYQIAECKRYLKLQLILRGETGVFDFIKYKRLNEFIVIKCEGEEEVNTKMGRPNTSIESKVADKIWDETKIGETIYLDADPRFDPKIVSRKLKSRSGRFSVYRKYSYRYSTKEERGMYAFTRLNDILDPEYSETVNVSNSELNEEETEFNLDE